MLKLKKRLLFKVTALQIVRLRKQLERCVYFEILVVFDQKALLPSY